jgi:hypothetical protein
MGIVNLHSTRQPLLQKQPAQLIISQLRERRNALIGIARKTKNPRYGGFSLYTMKLQIA